MSYIGTNNFIEKSGQHFLEEILFYQLMRNPFYSMLETNNENNAHSPKRYLLDKFDQMIIDIASGGLMRRILLSHQLGKSKLLN